MLLSEEFEVFYVGNNSTSTAYAIPFDRSSDDDVRVSKITAGTGTVTIVSGAVTFSSSQSTVLVGSHLRVSGETYTIATRTSATVFAITDHGVSVSASAFHLIDDATALVSGSTFTLTDDEITTDPAIATTALVRIYRETPLTQETQYPDSGPFDPSTMEDALDKLTMIAQEQAGSVQNNGIIVPQASGSTTADTTTFANAAARSAATPTRIGQQGIQLDTNVEYYGTAVTAGSWQAIAASAPAKTYASFALLDAATPDVIGQVAYANNRHQTFVATSTSAGGFDAVTKYDYGIWTAVPWTEDEPLVPGQRRWAGTIGRQGFFDYATATTASAGTGTLTFKIHIVPDLGSAPGVAQVSRELASSTITLTNSYLGTVIAEGTTPNFTDSFLVTAGTSGMTGIFDRVEVEIISIGSGTTQTTTEGSTVITIPAIATLPISTGTRINVLNRPDAYVVAVRGDGAVVMTNAAVATAADEAITYGGRIMLRGVMGLAAVAGARTITVVAADAELIDIGAAVVGDTVAPGTVVAANNGSTTITLSTPLLGDTAAITFINRYRAPVVHHVVINEPNGEDDIVLGSTKNLRVGDTARGLYIPATAHITAIDTGTNTATITPAISGGDIAEITFTYPVKSVTGVAGDLTFTVDNAVGSLNGTRVEGPGVPADTFVTDVTGTTVTISNPLSLSVTTENVMFTRDTLQATASVSSASGTVTLPFATSTTPLEVGFEVTGDEIRAGTFITAIGGGSTITISPAPHTTNAAAVLQFERNSSWKGMCLNLAGPYLPYIA